MKTLLMVAVLTTTLGIMASLYWNSEIGKIRRFWSWFEGYRSAYERQPSQIDPSDISHLSDRIHTISSDLTFQIGKASDGEGYELEISADGDRAVFPLVEQVVACAPSIPQWNILAFRQPNPAIIEMGDVTVDPEQVMYFAVQNSTTDKFDVILYYKSFQYENEQWQQALFVTLDNTLGEYDFATKVSTVNFMNTADADTRIRSNLRPISELKKELDNKI